MSETSPPPDLPTALTPRAGWYVSPTRPGQGSGACAAPRCPYCHHAVPLPAVGAAVCCPECGGSFRLEGEDRLRTEVEVHQLDRFQLLERVGQGGFGTVWRARDLELGRIVALKVPHGSFLSAPDYLERCRREARAAAQLRHPGIVRLYEVVTLEGLPVLVSDFIDGVPLKDLLAARRLTFTEAAGLIADVAEALDHAHAQGLVHRDVKPGNLMVESSPPSGTPSREKKTPSLGKPIVVDFGLALRDEAEIVMTLEGQVIGTPAYMSPEQAAGRGHRVDRRTDVYSLGVVLYELLCGERPFRGAKAMLVHQVLHEEPRSPRRLNDRIPRDLETICLKAMAKEPSRRYATAGAFAEDLRRFLRREPIAARPVGRVERGWRWCRRNPAVSLLTLAVAGALVAGLAVSLSFAFWALAEKRAAQEQAAETRQQKQLSDRRRYGTEITLAQQAWLTGQLGLTRRQLDLARPGLDTQSVPEVDADFRGFEWYYLDRLCRLDLATWRGHRQAVHGLAFSPDGRWLASGGDDRTIILWDVAQGKVAFLLPGHTQAVRAVAFSPDGRYLASAGEPRQAPGAALGEVKLWDLAQQREAFSLPGFPGAVLAIAFSPDGRHLAYGGGRTGGGGPFPGELRIWDLAENREAFPLVGHKDVVRAIAFSPDGSRLVSGGADKLVLLWDANRPSSPVLPPLDGPKAPVLSVAFSPDGQRVAAAGWDQKVRLWDATTGRAEAILEGHLAPVQSVAFSPDGRQLASAGMDQVVRLWDASSEEVQHVWRGHSQRIYQVAFSPDGWRLATASEDQTIKLWDVGGEREPRSLTGSGSIVRCTAFSPDGRTLVTGSADRTVKIWDVGLGLPVETWRGHQRGVMGVAFSPDGQRLASASTDRTVKVWSFPAGENLLTLNGHRDAVVAVAFRPQGDQLASAGDDQVLILWDVQSGRRLHTLVGHHGSVRAVAYSPDGGTLASASADGLVKTWDAATGKELASWSEHEGAARAVAFSPDGRWLASCGDDQVVVLRDLASGSRLRPLRGHTARIFSLAFSPDSQRLATASGDKTVKLWDTVTGQLLLNLEGHNGSVASLAFSPDGWQIASASYDGTAKVWDARPRTAAVDAQRQAMGLLEWHFGLSRPLNEVLARLSAETTVSEAVRQEAVRLAEPYGRGLIHGEADGLVQALAKKLFPRPDLVEQIRATPGLSEPVRQRALKLAEQFVEDPAQQYGASWQTLRRLDQDRATYQLALRQAEAACRLVPGNGSYQTALGLAHYRLGNYAEAVQVLTRAQDIGGLDSFLPACLTFLALSQQQLGKHEAARVTLARLRELLPRPTGATPEDVQALLREAETLIEPRD